MVTISHTSGRMAVMVVSTDRRSTPVQLLRPGTPLLSGVSTGGEVDILPPDPGAARACCRWAASSCVAIGLGSK